MRTIYIYGYTGYSKRIRAMMESTEQFGGFILDEQYITDGMSREIISWESFLRKEKNEEDEILVTIGYSHMNDGRKAVTDKVKNAGYKLATFVHPSAILLGKPEIGEGTIIEAGCLIDPNVKIGNGCIVNCMSYIGHDSIIEDFCWIGVQSVVLGHCTVGSYSFVGANATIRDGTHIAKRTLIGAGAFINSDTADGSVWVPARSIELKKKSFDVQI